jgi:hypothetical protein
VLITVDVVGIQTPYTVSAPPPALYATGDRSPVANAYFAVTVDTAVDLLAAPAYRDLPRAERVAKARAEQQRFLNDFFDPALGAALDLRVAADPKAGTPLSVSLLGRVWGNSTDEVTERAGSLQRRVHAAMPRHVTATVVEDAEAVVRLLSPLSGSQVDSAVITRHELISPPSRPDAGVSYYYSAVGFTGSGGDWSEVYAALAASPVPAVLSVAVLPLTVPSQFAQTLRTLAAFYGRLAREGEPQGPYGHRQRAAPDAFAVDAEQAFDDFSARLSQRAFALRIQVSAAKRLPPGLAETIARAISPGEPDGSLAEHQAAVPAYDIRRPASVAERRLAEYNLNVINFGMLTGRPEIWDRPDPPDPQLAMLSVLGDAREAAAAFRFPIAADGTVPGLLVGGGRAALAAAQAPDGAGIPLGHVSGTGDDVTVPLRSLTGPALITGAAGSGKTATARELLRRLWDEHGIPFLVIEPANSGGDGYRSLGAEPGFESLEVITAGDEGGAPLRFNPFEVPAGILVGEHAAELLACFTVAFGLREPLRSVYRGALALTYLRSGFLAGERAGVDDGRGWPTMAEFIAAMDEAAAGRGDDGERRAGLETASVGRARRLASGFTGSALMTDRPNDLGRLLDHPVVLELGTLGPGDEQALVMALVLNAVTEHRRAAGGAASGLVHVTLLEEAHRLLARAEGARPLRDARARERAAAAFADALAGNRRYGEGLIMAERSPARLVAEAVKNTGLRIIHRLTAEDDQRYLGQTTGLDESRRGLAARLRTGEALLDGDGFTDAAPVSITVTSPTDAPPPGAVGPSATPPFAACDRCRAQCAYRGAALSLVNDPVITGRIADAARLAGRREVTPTTRQASLDELRGVLLEAVGRYAALPAADPGRSDAAYCLFLHASRVSAGPDRSAAVAGLLGVTAPEEG